MSRDHEISKKPRVRAAKLEDCQVIARNMREEDRLELFHSSHSTPLDALKRGFESSEICKVIIYDGEPIAMFGIVRDIHAPEVGIPWMLATPEIVKIRKSFLRRAGEELKKLSFGFRVLSNMVWGANSIHILWLRWLGFTVQADRPVIRSGSVFYPFWRSVDV